LTQFRQILQLYWAYIFGFPNYSINTNLYYINELTDNNNSSNGINQIIESRDSNLIQTTVENQNNLESTIENECNDSSESTPQENIFVMPDQARLDEILSVNRACSSRAKDEEIINDFLHLP
jgi:hypothetical protein